MAVNYSDKTREELEKLQQGYQQGQAVAQAQQNLNNTMAAKPGEYTASQSVQNAQNALDNWNAQKPGDYQASGTVQSAMNALSNILNNKPQAYTSKYAATLDSILNQIQNPEEFKYEFNGDNLFKAYADLYTQKGKQAALDVQGQAAGLTGGYGNSYGQTVGQQQYQQYLLGLYDKGLDLRDRAYDQYLNERADLKDQYQIFSQADATDYNRYRDTVGDWLNERNYITDFYNTERNFDYNKYRDAVSDWTNERNYLADTLNNERAFDYNRYRDTVSDWQNERNYYTDVLNNAQNYDYATYQDALNYWTNVANTEADEAYRQSTLAEQIRQADLDESYRRDTLAESIRSTDLDEAYRQAQLAENIRQANLDESYRRDTLAEDIRQSDQKYAYNYVMSIIANGQMPSDELLAAAGITRADAALMIAQAQGNSGGSGGGKGSTVYPNPNGDGTYSYYKYDNKGKLVQVSEEEAKKAKNIDDTLVKVAGQTMSVAQPTVATTGVTTMQAAGLKPADVTKGLTANVAAKPAAGTSASKVQTASNVQANKNKKNKEAEEKKKKYGSTK